MGLTSLPVPPKKSRQWPESTAKDTVYTSSSGRFHRENNGPPSRNEIARGLSLHPSTVGYQIQQLVRHGVLETVGPRRAIKLLDASVPVVRLGPIQPTESVTETNRQLGTMPTATANEFEPYATMFAVVNDDSLERAGLHPGDRVALTRAEHDWPDPGCIVLVRWNGGLVLRRYRKRTRRTIALEPESGNPNHRTITAKTTDPNLTLEGKVIGALVSCADR